jgi:endogenous inhibitor of DNA gyrase (YacG/DUF329 family)
MKPEKEKTCPTCGKPSVEKFVPFCSARCAQVDLGRWLTESYVVETDEPPSLDDGGVGEA